MRSVFILSFLSLFAIGCAKQSSQVSLRLSTSAIFGAAGGTLENYAQGGLMVWGMNADRSAAFGKALIGTDQIDLELPNGQWTFYAMAWQNGSNVPLFASAANVRCAKSPTVSLAGTPVSPLLELRNSNCNDLMFSGAAPTAAGNQVDVQVCESVANITSGSDACTEFRTNPNHKADKVPVRSARIRLLDYGRNVGLAAGPGIAASCAPFTADGQWSFPADTFLPMGSVANPASSPFSYEIEFFFNSDNCNASAEGITLLRVPLVNGFAGASGTLRPDARYFYSGGDSRQRLYLQLTDQQICQGRQNLAPFAAGVGLSGFPYIICSPQQFYRIVDGTSGRLSASYRLASSIDILSFGKFLDATTPATLFAGDTTCWSPGQNWQPLGLSYAAPPACTPGMGNFSGNFDGNGHFIRGLRMRIENGAGVGLISNWDPLATNQFVRDLRLERSEVSAQNSAAILVGRKSNALYGQITGITINDAKLETRMTPSHAGMVIGNGTNVNLENIRVLRSEIRAEGSMVGGVFGNLMNAQRVKRIMSRVHIKPRYPGAQIMDVGGIGGTFSSSALEGTGLSEWSHEGIIVSTGARVGGLVGSMGPTGGVGLSNFYAQSAITAVRTDTSNDVGGLFGASEINGNLINGYFAGHIIDSCITGCNRGYLIGNRLVAPGGFSSVQYVSTDMPPIAGNGENAGSLFGTVTSANEGSLLSNPAGLNTGAFVHQVGDHPRLVWEQHPCSAPEVNGISSRSTLAQQGTVRGTATNPIIICNKTQLQELSSYTVANKHFRLATAIGMRVPFSPVNLQVSSHTLDGGEGFLYAYVTSAFPLAGLERRAPFVQNFGRIQNLRLSNITPQSNGSAGPESGIAGVVGTNAGTLENIQVFHADLRSVASMPSMYIAGIAAFNTATGRIQFSDFRGYLRGRWNVGGLVGENAGRIYDSNFSGKIEPNGAPLTRAAGVAVMNWNTGEIARVALSESRIVNGSLGIEGATFGVFQNNGVLRDFEVNSSVRWELNATFNSFATVVINNTGTVQRAVIAGQLAHTDITDSTPQSGSGKPVYVGDEGSGVITMSPGGRRVIHTSASQFSCVAPGRVRFNGSLPGGIFFNSGGSYWTSYNPGFETLWFVVEEQGDLKVARVTSLNTTVDPIEFDLDRVCAEFNLLGGGMASIVQDMETSVTISQGNLFSPPYSGVFYTSSEITSGHLMGPWAGSYYDDTLPTDQQALFNFFANMLVSGTQQVPPRPWELEDGRGLGLISVKD